MKNNKLARWLILSFCLSFISVATAQSAAQEKQSDRKTMRLRGEVRKIEILAASGGLKDVYIFNKAGDIVEQASVYLNENRIYKKIVNFYDESGRKTAAEFYVEGVLKTKSTFQYDEVNNAVEQIDYSAEGKLISKTVRKYDAGGNIVEMQGNLTIPLIFGSENVDRSVNNYREFYRYDENGNIAEARGFAADVKVPFLHVSFAYNKENQKVEETSFTTTYFDKPPRISKHFHTYNKQGDVVETRNYEPIKESNVEEVKDRFKVVDNKGTVQNGLLISDKPFMILWDVTVCEYVYDARGNWTKQTCRWKMRETKDFIPASDSPTVRIIGYFP
jgi:hypothetical protein